MICRQCLTRASLLARRTSRAPFSSLPALRASDPPPPAPKFTTPTTSPNDLPTAPPPEPKSACPAGTVLTGLNYFKGKQDPVALPDEDYPEWLWRCLELPPKPEADSSAAAAEFSKSKKQRRIAAKKQRVFEAKILASGDVEALAPKIPLEHQTVNLPDGGDGGLEGSLHAAEKRQELKKAMRASRKLKIKENNFLRSM